MDAELRGPGPEMRAALDRLAAGPAHIRKALNREIKTATEPLELKLKEAILGIDSAGVRGGGTAARAAARDTGSGRLPTHTGLRASTARGVQRKITYRGFRTGVRIRVDTSKMPEGQRVLPKAMNRGKVRHPVMGRENTWVDQVFTPPGWFDRTMEIYGPRARDKIAAAVSRAVQELQ